MADDPTLLVFPFGLVIAVAILSGAVRRLGPRAPPRGRARPAHRRAQPHRAHPAPGRARAGRRAQPQADAGGVPARATSTTSRTSTTATATPPGDTVLKRRGLRAARRRCASRTRCTAWAARSSPCCWWAPPRTRRLTWPAPARRRAGLLAHRRARHAERGRGRRARARASSSFDFAALFEDADRALYEAKERGRNCVVTAGPTAHVAPEAPGSLLVAGTEGPGRVRVLLGVPGATRSPPGPAWAPGPGPRRPGRPRPRRPCPWSLRSRRSWAVVTRLA